jgi:crotonobetainyl-CoA:carnitine CoA-transferase CaiB-like acyl-CoA transferase
MERVPGVPVLDGLKVLEIDLLIAGPMAGSLMADFGAEVIHLEDPLKGDPGRNMGLMKEGKGLWWKVSARNKRCVTLNLRSEEGRAIVRRLARWADVVVTNFRVDTLERWGLDWPSLHAENPKLIVLQISGFGATATLRNRPGLGKMGEAMSGVVEITGWPDGPPVHTGFSHSDTVTGLMGAFAVMAAAYRSRTDPDFDGEWIDLALFESLYRLIEWQVISYDQLDLVPTRAGNQMAVTPAAVVNTYLTADGYWITVTSGTVKAVSQVVAMLGQPVEDYDTAEKQRQGSAQLDQMLKAWIGSVTMDEALASLAEAEVVASKIFTVDDIVHDETYREREDVITIEDQDFGPVRMQGVIPKLSQHPGKIWRTGPSIGEDNDYVYKKMLGMTDDELERLHADGVI